MSTSIRTPVLAATGLALTLLTGCTGMPGPLGAPEPATATATHPAEQATTVAAARPASRPVTGPAAHEVAEARAMLAALPVGGRGPHTGYLRTKVFGSAWADVDGNGCNTRDDVLARDLTAVAKRNRCVVVAGQLREPYTGAQVTFRKADAIAVQIDHVVPLSLAWQLGAAQWPQGERVAFANDPANLLAVDGPANEQKSDSGPDAWLPPNKAYRCTYVIRFTRVATLYALRITGSMRAAISAQLDQCRSVTGTPADLQPLPASLWSRAAHLAGY